MCVGGLHRRAISKREARNAGASRGGRCKPNCRRGHTCVFNSTLPPLSFSEPLCVHQLMPECSGVDPSRSELGCETADFAQGGACLSFVTSVRFSGQTDHFGRQFAPSVGMPRIAGPVSGVLHENNGSGPGQWSDRRWRGGLPVRARHGGMACGRQPNGAGRVMQDRRAPDRGWRIVRRNTTRYGLLLAAELGSRALSEVTKRRQWIR